MTTKKPATSAGHQEGVVKKRLAHHGGLNVKPLPLSPPAGELYAYKPANRDYVTTIGLELRTEAKPHQFGVFALRELIDNALDFIERQAQKGKKCPDATVRVKVVKKPGGLCSLKVTNPNFKMPAFTEERLLRIFDFTASYSSKRNINRISRGALGDALKSVIGIPYALAAKNNVNWKAPMIFRSGHDRYEITLTLATMAANIVHTTEEKFSEFTEVEICIPEQDADWARMTQLLRGFAIANTHITWHIEVQDRRTIDCLAIEEIRTPWYNPLSIHSYSIDGFQQFINDLEDNSALAYDVIRAFREGTNIRKDSTTVGELKQTPARVKGIYDELKKTMAPVPADRMEAPFQIRQKTRAEALKKRLSQLGYSVAKIKYKPVKEIASNASFPFLFEIGIAELSGHAYGNFSKYEFINCSPHVYYNPFTSSKYENAYIWKKGKSAKEHHASSITEILKQYDYSPLGEMAGRRPPSLIIANLISPRIDFKSYGKSDFDLEPFADKIASAVVETCGPRKRKFRLYDRETGRDEEMSAMDVLRDVLKKRLDAVEQDPTLKVFDRWTQSTVFYKVRNRLRAHNMPVPARKSITDNIRAECGKLGKMRHELGIFAADRAQLYFRGKYYDVGFEELKKLAEMGADFVICEKENLVDVLAPYADKVGIALLNSRGFLPEYASSLSKLSHEHGANVAVITDFDGSGWYLASLVKNAVRIGINFDTLDYFNIRHDNEDVVEGYNPEEHMANLWEELALWALPKNSRKRREFEFIAGRGFKVTIDEKGKRKFIAGENPQRVQIDMIVPKVGAKKFWQYIVSQLREHFPTRNYNRSIQIPPFTYPPALKESLDKIEHYMTELSKPVNEQVHEELESVRKLIDVKEKDEEIKQRQIAVAEADETTKQLIDALQSAVEMLGRSDDEEEGQAGE